MGIQLQNFVSLTTTGTSGASTLTNGVLNVPNYATSGGTWVDYSATSTIVGWSSFTIKKIYYIIVGKQLFVRWYLGGTSNSTSTTFTLPNNNINMEQVMAAYCVNNGATISGNSYIIENSNICTGLIGGSTAWTASGTKSFSGNVFIQIA